MRRGDIVEGIVERVDFPNKALVRLDESHTVTVKNAIPGQKVSARIKKVRHGNAEGNLVQIIDKAENEIEPLCPHFGNCGGCNYQNLSYDDQLKLKEGQVRKLLDGAITDYEYEWLGINQSPVNCDYRNKMELTFGDEYMGGPLALGMHKRGSFYDIVNVDGCRICDADYREIIRTTRTFFSEKGVPYYHRMRHEGYLRHLLVRKAAYTGEILVALITTTQMDIDLAEYKDMLLELKLSGEIVGILHTKNDSLADVVQSDETVILFGRDYITEKMLGMQFNISEFSFFQTNTKSAEVLYTTAREFIGELGDGEKIVYDLYSGTGTIAQMMAPVCKKVIGVEIVEEAVEAAKENARLNGLDNCEFIAGDVLKVLDDIEEKPDFIILDPPRDGIHPKALRKIVDYGVDRMIYISCKPTSLVRDLEMLQACGYRVEKAVAVDQFPATGHVETVCLLSKKAPV
ncbi:MAG: 23S rRNA (uracil(1939)-C(5))-methyltransferase RlmD [Lachnospiraceae bacterium]|nr:23S rRNA (uracil(1939)-C(5))-methyltransferase RlmD [Candidatus Colinaster scatohippi]